MNLLRSHRLWLAVILLFAGAVRLVLIDQPFSRNTEGFGSYYGVRARNFFRHDLSVHRGVPIQSVGIFDDMEPRFYHQHPPLVFWLVGLSYATLGDGEWQTRLPSALFTLGSIYLIFHLLHRTGRTRAALLAAGLFAAMPMALYFGGHVDCINSTLVFFVLLSIWLYLRLHERPAWKNLAMLALGFAPAAMTDWPAFYLLPILGLHYVVTKPPRDWVYIVGFGLIGCAFFASIYAHIAIHVDDWRWMSDKLHRRTLSSEADKTGAFTLGDWLVTAARYNIAQHTRPVLLLGFLWLILFAWRIKRIDPAATTTRLVFAFAALHVIIGKQAVLVHEWWWWPVTAALALAAGLMIDWILESISKALVGASETRPMSPIVLPIAIACVVLFAAWNTQSIMRYFFDPKYTQGPMNFSTVEFGEAIRRAAPTANTAVAIAYDNRYDLPLWFYGDRPLKFGVWDIHTLQRRMTDGRVDLPYGDHHAWPAAPVALVIPKVWVKFIPVFVQDLQHRYPADETEKFLIFRLTSPPGTQPIE